ncbi:MAG: hypothetical protein IJW43_04595 [Clostridia bacterium]|nr:hypothetical protein [Clostridia bacterium]
MVEFVYDETVVDNNRESNKKKYNFYNVLGIILVLITAIWGGYVIAFIPTISYAFLFFGLIPIIICILIIFFLFRKRDTYLVDYDYQFATGDVNISKVINYKKRKSGVSFRCVELDAIGLYDSERFNKFKSVPSVKTLYMTSNDSPCEGNDFYYVFYSRKEEKYLVILECSKRFVSCLINYSNKSIVDEDLKRI